MMGNNLRLTVALPFWHPGLGAVWQQCSLLMRHGRRDGIALCSSWLSALLHFGEKVSVKEGGGDVIRPGAQVVQNVGMGTSSFHTAVPLAPYSNSVQCFSPPRHCLRISQTLLSGKETFPFWHHTVEDKSERNEGSPHPWVVVLKVSKPIPWCRNPGLSTYPLQWPSSVF